MRLTWGLRAGVLFFVSVVASVGLRADEPPTDAAAGASRPRMISPNDRAGFALQMPLAGAADPRTPSSLMLPEAPPAPESYTHTPAPDPSKDLLAGSGQVMTSTTIYYVFWLPTGLHYEADAAGDTNYENLLTRWANDLGSSQFLNLISQYSGTNGTVGTSVTFGGSWTDATAYPHAGTTADPLTDSDIQTEVKSAVAANAWTEDVNHIVAVFTANGIQECQGSKCTSSATGGFCAYHDHFSDGGHDAVYAFMGFDNFVHVAGKTCVAGETTGDNDPNRGVYPNNDVSADAEINTLSHEVIEAQTDPHPNDTWTGPNSEIGDACNFNFAPRNDIGADVYLNGHPYIMQQEWSNVVHTCAMDLPTNGFCSGSVGNVCSPTTSASKSVDNPTPRVLSTIHYTLTLNNANDTGAETNLSLTDSVPPGYTVTGLSAPFATSSSSTSTSVTVAYDTLPVHQSRTVTVTASVPIQAGTTATNCGDLAGSDLLGAGLAPQTTSPCAQTTPVKIPTIVTYTGATRGDYHDAATVAARLTDDLFNPLAGKTIVFTLNGTETCSGVTNGSGIASCSITPGEIAGAYPLKAAFNDAGDPVYAVSSTTTSFTVTPEETTTIYTGPTVILAGSGGATLSATLVEDGASDDDGDGGSPGPVPAETVTLSIGAQSCTGTTNPLGDVSCTIPTVIVPLGPETVGAAFAGDGYYRPSSASTTAIVFAFPSRGAFVLGDVTVSKAGSDTVTWWSATWPRDNVLGGGTAPAAFKGFAGTITLPTTTPPAAASAWTTRPGNSTPPTSDVPSYMGVVVTDSVSKAAGTISGDSVHIVVVRTDPGYEPNPGHRGTGTIVATFY